MLDILFIPVAILYLLAVGLLFVFGVNFLHLTYLAWRDRDPPNDPPMDRPWPRVTVQLPIYNELYVARRLIEATARLDYPRERLEIQVLDDSTDETLKQVGETVARLRERGLEVVHLRRRNRQGFKAGALAEGLKHARGDFLAIFDADFIPNREFLKRTIPHFFQDERVAFVQTRWGHLNRDYSLLTFLQSLAIDAHFMVEQHARSQASYWFNFNGTAGVWRRKAIEDAGGWMTDTLTEDLDLSYRAFLRGWKAMYLRDVEVPAELPVSFSAFRRQQGRWARGSLECALKLLPRVWKADVSLRLKLEATLHLTGYSVHLLLFTLASLYPLVLILSLRYPSLLSLFGIAVFFNATAFVPTAFFVVAQRRLGRRWVNALPMIFFMTALGAGMMLNTVRALLEILLGRKRSFERTPKFGILRRDQRWRGKGYQIELDSIVFAELAFALVNLGTVWLGVRLGNWVIAAYAGLFSLGLFFTSGSTIAQTLLAWRQERRGLVPSSA